MQTTNVVYTINEVEVTFNIDANGKVVRERDSVVICETGGEACLEEWVQSQMF